MSFTDWKSLPTLGVGLAFRLPLLDGIRRNSERIDVIEIITEMLFEASSEDKAMVLSLGRPIVCHGLRLSPGSLEGLDRAYVSQVAETIRDIRPAWFSDHLSISRSGSAAIDNLSPLWYTDATAAAVTENIRHATAAVGIPFLVENIACYFQLPGSAMRESAFLSNVVRGADCGILLDLNNLHCNAVNFGFDPYAYLDDLPMERVVQVHLAGGAMKAGRYVDTHAHPINEAVWTYYEYVCSRASVRATIIERDRQFPEFEELLEEVERAREILRLSAPPEARRQDAQVV